MAKVWNWKYNPLRIAYNAFFCKADGSFSAKKSIAFVISALAIANHSHLHFAPATHWTVTLTQASVDNVVQTALIASLDALAGGALAVYGWSKAKGAA